MDQTLLKLEGECNYKTFNKVKLENLGQEVCLDCSKVQSMDFSFAIFLDEYFKDRNIKYHLINAHHEIEEIFELIGGRKEFELYKPSFSFLGEIGKWLYAKYEAGRNFLNFFGLFAYHLLVTLFNPTLLRFSSLIYHINNAGFKALPVGLVTCAIVSSAISIQGVLQLQKMGVPLASVETMAKLALREMGPFIFAIVVAGRSASSFTAQIGVMRITEELDAMKTMGFDWYRFIVLPRFLALVIAMPLLVFVADFASLLASACVIVWQTGITFSQYVERFYEFVGLMNLWVGVIKAPFFGAVIALVGCYRGLEIRGDTQSVGKYTTISVVNALFWMIFVNAIFSIIFTRFNV